MPRVKLVKVPVPDNPGYFRYVAPTADTARKLEERWARRYPVTVRLGTKMMRLAFPTRWEAVEWGRRMTADGWTVVAFDSTDGQPA